MKTYTYVDKQVQEDDSVLYLKDSDNNRGYLEREDGLYLYDIVSKRVVGVLETRYNSYNMVKD